MVWSESGGDSCGAVFRFSEQIAPVRHPFSERHAPVMVRPRIGQATEPDTPATRGLATAAIRIAIAAGRSEHTQDATGDAVGQDLCGYVIDAGEVLLDLWVGAG